ncbi:hypothetical protein [Lentibacillus sediminis]|uniref:hypothetical protein n=1 Tax=Lentibacillus sediminis TaxID=1940529 RepID=UPI000C1C3A2F|nr:hypothetical protein [Lentibacillus sediminis]
MLKNRWIGWLSLLLSIIPIVVFIAILGGADISNFILFSPLFLSIVLAVIAIINKAELKLVPAIALIFSVGSGAFFLLIITVSGMGQPT